MESRSSYGKYSVRLSPTEGVWLVNLVPAKIKVKGVSGKEYLFDGAGSTQYVNVEDVDGLMAHYRNPCECSSVVGLQPYFSKMMEV